MEAIVASTNVVARSVNELSLAAWFGGSLFGSLALARADDGGNGSAQSAAAWDEWRQVEAAAMAAQLLSGTVLTLANRRRVVGQSGVGLSTVTRMAITGAATAATLLVRRQATRAEADDSSSDQVHAPPSAALRWSVPVLTGTMLVLDAWMGEQQRPASVLSGVVRRLKP
jgi:hypothetical protein